MTIECCIQRKKFLRSFGIKRKNQFFFIMSVYSICAISISNNTVVGFLPLHFIYEKHICGKVNLEHRSIRIFDFYVYSEC